MIIEITEHHIRQARQTPIYRDAPYPTEADPVITALHDAGHPEAQYPVTFGTRGHAQRLESVSQWEVLPNDLVLEVLLSGCACVSCPVEPSQPRSRLMTTR